MRSKAARGFNVFLVMLLVLGMFNLGAARDAAADYVDPTGDIAHEDFQSYAENDKPSSGGWSYTENVSSGSVSIVKVTGKGDASDQGLSISRTAASGSADLLARRTLPSAQTGQIVVRANILAKQTNAVVYALNLKSSGNAEIANILFTESGKIAYQLSNGSYAGAETTLQSYSVNTWYEVMVVLDTQSRKLAIYIDGVKKKEGIDFKSINASDFKTVEFQVFRTYTGTAYMDDLNIYTHQVAMSQAVCSLVAGQTGQLTAEVSPALPALQPISWSSSDTTVVSVETSGKIHALRAGTAVIRAMTSGGASDSCTVNVSEAPFVPLHAISLDKETVNLIEGSQARVHVIFDPADASSLPLAWQSNDETVASVTFSTYARYAVITGVHPGVTTVSVQTEDGHEAHATIHVRPKGDLYSESFDSTEAGQFPASLNPNGTAALAVTSVAEIPDATNKSLRMTKEEVTDSSLFVIKTLPDALTKATIAVRAMAMQTNAIVYIPIVVNENNGAVTQLAFYNNGNLAVLTEGAWKSIQPYEAGRWYDIEAAFDTGTGKMDIYVDGVLAAGQVKFIEPSQRLKSMQLGMYRLNTGVAYFDDINVYAYKPLEGFGFERATEQLALGGSMILKPLFTPEAATFRSLIWTSSNPDVASINEQGIVTPKTVGSTTITAVSATDSSLAASVHIDVVVRHVESVSVDPAIVTLPAGASNELIAKAVISPADASDKTVVWSSSNPDVASVDEEGGITTAREGTAQITVSTRDGNKTASFDLIVTPRAVQTAYYVSPTGSDDQAGTIHAPFRSLEKARDAVRQINGNMTGDIIVYLQGGTYSLDGTFLLDERDSGSNGYKVIYKALTPGDLPILSGGRQITGWQLHDPVQNIYKASAEAAIETRQLYVNGARAVRAKSQGGLTNPVRTATGYTSDDTFLAGWSNIEDLEFVYKAEWTNPRDGVQSVAVQNGKAVITMKEPGWSAMIKRASVTYPWTYENALELLDEEGEWYMDRPTGTFYYKPRPGEDMSTAYVVAPTAEELVSIRGRTPGSPVHHIQFEGIAFSYTTWLRPNSNLGHVDAQNNHLRYPPDPDVLPPAVVTVERANHIDFERNEFSKLGITALKMVNGVQNSRIRGNRFYDISGSAINVGDPTRDDPAIYNPSDARLLMKNIDVLNNYIHDIGVEYRSSAAISAGFPVNMNISHNEIFNIPYSGIHVGYGWANIQSSALRNMKIENNFIHDLFGEGLYDGGAIYTLGGTGGTLQSPNLIRGNYIRNQMNRHGALYPDEGSSFWRIEDNVVDLSETPLWEGIYPAKWAHVWIASIHDIEFKNNYTTTPEYRNDATRVTFTGTTVVPDADWPQAARDIINEAGLQTSYADIASNTLERLEYPRQVNLSQGQMMNLVVAATTGKGEALDLASQAELFYSSDNEAVVTVNSQGIVEAVGSGGALVKVSVKMSGLWKILTIPVNVNDVLDRIEFKNAPDQNLMLVRGTSKSLLPVGISRYGQTLELNDVSYASSAPEIVSVNRNGELTANRRGTAEITVTGTWNNTTVQASITIRVIQYGDDSALYDQGFKLNEAIADPDRWYVNATGINNKETREGEIEISTPGGFATYQGNAYDNELLTFNMTINAVDGWPSIVLRSQKSDESFSSTTNDLYMFGFKPDQIELQRFNKGVRTVLFGSIDGTVGIGGEAYPNTVVPYHTTHLVQVGAITERDGVRLVLNVDGRNIFNFLDTGTGKIDSPGYMGLYARSGSITLGVVPESAMNGPKNVNIGEEFKLGLSLDESNDGLTVKDVVFKYDRQAFEFKDVQSLHSGIQVSSVVDDQEGKVTVQLNGDPLSLEEATKILEFTLKAVQENAEATAGVSFITLERVNGTLLRTAHAYAQVQVRVPAGGGPEEEGPADEEELPEEHTEHGNSGESKGNEGAGEEEQPETSAEISFPDTAGHWADSGIRKAAALGIVNGYADGKFHPEAPVTRAEFTVMAARVLQLQGEGSNLSLFADRDQIGDWAAQAISQAVEAGLINGYEDGTFRQGALISRAEMVVMLGRALGFTSQGNGATGFADDADIPDWARRAVGEAAKLAIVNGRSGNLFAPRQSLTRAEAVTVMLRIGDYFRSKPEL